VGRASGIKPFNAIVLASPPRGTSSINIKTDPIQQLRDPIFIGLFMIDDRLEKETVQHGIANDSGSPGTLQLLHP
jgi:hypothetical protein